MPKKFDYVKITFDKKDYYLLKETYVKFVDTGFKEYNPFDSAIYYLRKKELLQKLKIRKSDSFVYSTKEELAELKKKLIKLGTPIAKKEKKQGEEDEKRWKKEEKKDQKKEKIKAIKIAKTLNLPKGIKPEDLVRHNYYEKDEPTQGQIDSVDLRHISPDGYSNQFRMYLVDQWGWCIPTLLISNARRQSGLTDRSYAIRISNGETVRVGMGPHVKKQITIYVKKSNFNRLKPLFNKMKTGAVDANQIRDVLSTRRMRRRSYAW